MTKKWNDAREMVKKGNYFVVFTTQWCPDCKMMKPVIFDAVEELRRKGFNLPILEIDAEEADLFRKSEEGISVLKVPSMFVVKNGKYTHIGYEYIPKEEIVEEALHVLK